jgi:hypothetical protein
MGFAATSEAAPSASEIRIHLSHICESGPFRASRRCQDLLTYLVERTLEGRQHILKERVIGVEVFNRATDYNPASDPVVRVGVGEVRKRLAQYYQANSSGGRAPRIAIPIGHYLPEFTWTEVAPSEPATLMVIERAPARRGRTLVWAVPVLAIAGAVGLWFGWHGRTAVDDFWGPAFHSRMAPLLVTERYGAGSFTHRLNAEWSRGDGESTASAKQLTSDIAATFSEAVMFGNVYALRSLDRLFSSKGGNPELRIGGEVTMSDMADRPVILVGYFNNPWAKNLAREKLRFTLTTERAPGAFTHTIRDSLDPSKRWSITSDRPWFEDTATSYAIITRLYDRSSGRFLVSIGGMTHLATSAAAEFVTRASSLEGLRQQAPKGWEKGNVQVVVQTDIVNRTAAPPKMVAAHFW